MIVENPKLNRWQGKSSDVYILQKKFKLFLGQRIKKKEKQKQESFKRTIFLYLLHSSQDVGFILIHFSEQHLYIIVDVISTMDSKDIW